MGTLRHEYSYSAERIEDLGVYILLLGISLAGRAAAWERNEREKSVMPDRGTKTSKLRIRVGFTRSLLASDEDIYMDAQGEEIDSGYVDLNS